MKKGSTPAARQSRNSRNRSWQSVWTWASWYCVLDETGSVLLEQREPYLS